MKFVSDLTPRALAARERARKRWFVYLILCRGGAIYTGIARNVETRYAQHIAGAGARYTRANPPRRLLARFSCANQSEAGRLEAAIKKLTAENKRKLIGMTTATVRKSLGAPTGHVHNALVPYTARRLKG
jgi:putative endonuclease